MAAGASGLHGGCTTSRLGQTHGIVATRAARSRGWVGEVPRRRGWVEEGSTVAGAAVGCRAEEDGRGFAGPGREAVLISR